jgi:hypothetical protein
MSPLKGVKQGPNPAKGRKGETNHRWLPNGTTRVHHSGKGKIYRLIKINGQWMYEHRYVMEKHLGRPIASHEDVHHKNSKDTLNNNLDNLELLTKSDHMSHHGKAKPKGWDIYMDGCLNCGTTDIRYNGPGLCERCASAQFRQKNPEKIRQYNVVNNAKQRAKRAARRLSNQPNEPV